MHTLNLKLRGVSITDKEQAKYAVKFTAAKELVTIQFDDAPVDDDEKEKQGEWTYALTDAASMAVLVNAPQFEIYEVTTNKDSSLNETLCGTSTADWSTLLLGETQIEAERDIIDDDAQIIGSVQWTCSVEEPLFSEADIDANTFLSIAIADMKCVPPAWVDALALSHGDADAADGKKKKKGKQAPLMKHWLECQLQLFPRRAPSLNIQLINDQPPIEMEMQGDSENDDEEVKVKQHKIEWAFQSKHLMIREVMNSLIELSSASESHDAAKPSFIIMHCYEQLDENEEKVIKTDVNHLSGDIDLSTLFNAQSLDSDITLQFSDDAQNELKNASTIELKIAFDTPFQSYIARMADHREFAELFPSSPKQNDVDAAVDNDAATDDDSESHKCVEQIIEILVSEHRTFTAQTSIQEYDHKRARQAFVYHLNATGKYSEIKEKWVKPKVLQHLKSDPSLSAMFQHVLDDLMRSLSDTVAVAPLAAPPTQTTALSVRRDLIIGADFGMTDRLEKARIHHHRAYTASNGHSALPLALQWTTAREYIQTLLRCDEFDEAIAVCRHFLCAHREQSPEHAQCLLCLCCLYIEHKHADARTIVYELCARQKQPTVNSAIASTLKAAFFSLNGETQRGDISFNRAGHDRVDELFTVLFSLRCFGVIKCVLGLFQSRDQIDVHFHQRHAQMDAAQGRFGTALSSVLDALEIDDQCAELWALRGHIEFESDKADLARASYIRHLELIPGTAESLLPAPSPIDGAKVFKVDRLAVYRLAKMYAQAQEHTLALRTYFQGLESGESWVFWYEAGDALWKLKDYAQCIECFTQSNLINNNEPHSWCVLALCYVAQGQTQTALQMMDEALKFGTDRLSTTDTQHVHDFADQLAAMGHIQSSKFFKNAVEE